MTTADNTETIFKRYDIPEDCNVRSHRCDHLKSNKIDKVLYSRRTNQKWTN
jgi:hypothetical protein